MNPTQKKIAKQARSGCLALKLQGDVAGLTTYTTRRGRIVYFLQAPPNQPMSADQWYFRSQFRAAIALWNAMPKPQQQAWYRACKKAHLRIGPTALIVAAMMPGRTSDIRTIEKQSGEQLLDTTGMPLLTN